MDKVKLYKDFREKNFFDLSSPLKQPQQSTDTVCNLRKVIKFCAEES